MNHTKTFQIHRYLSQRLDKHFEQYKRSQRKSGKKATLSGYVNNLINNALDREIVLTKYAPAFKVVGVIDNTLHIRDGEAGRVYSVIRERNKLRCVEDDSCNCTHVMFAIATDQIARLFDDGDIEELPSPIRVGTKSSPSNIDGDGET